MTQHAWRLPFSLDPLMAEAKRRARQRRALVALGVVLLAGLAAGLTLALRSPGGRPSGGSATASYHQYGVSLRHPSGLIAVAWPCGSWSNANESGNFVSIALITSERGVTPQCPSMNPVAGDWPPLMALHLARNGISLALSRVKAWPAGYRPKWNGRLATVPTHYPTPMPLERGADPSKGLEQLRYGCPAGVPSETRAIAIRSRDRSEIVSADALICGPDFVADRAAFRQVIAGLRFTK